MSDVVLKWVGRAYVGHTGWPARDLTQAELDARGLDKDEMLAYRPKLYEEVRTEVVPEPEEAEVGPEAEEVEPAGQAHKKGKRKKEEAAPDNIKAEPAIETIGGWA